ncbi:YacL family protein [Thalassotalea litorea]|uniref:YacL family protein n=1 Tax=Thalassotalea litorea TaxID=2020715 RepID=UPI00373661CB
MEYEFYRDFIDGSPKAKFTYGHEVIGFWLEQEIGTNVSKLSALIQQLQQMMNNRYGQLQHIGKEFTLEADFQDVSVMANSHLQVTSDKVEVSDGDENEPYLQSDAESKPEFDDDLTFTIAECGSSDFVNMLTLWHEYLI